MEFLDSLYLVVWQDPRSGGYDIWATRLTRAGVVLDTFGIKVSAKAASEMYPAVATDGTNWLVVWSDSRSGVADIYGARVRLDGSLLDSTGFAISTALNTQTIPSISFNGTNYLVAWDDYRNQTWEVFAARVTPEAQVLEPAGIQITSGAGLYPSVSASDQDWLVAWHNGSENEIRATRVAPDGSVREPNGFLVSRGSNDRLFPHVTFGGGNWFLVWQDRRRGTSVNHWSIFGARVDSAGTVLDPDGIEIQIDDSRYTGIPSTCAGDSYYLVTWKDDGYGQLTGSRVTYDGTVLEPNGFPCGGLPHWWSEIAWDGTNWLAAASGFRVATWDLGWGADVFATRISRTGVVLDPYPNIQLATSANWQYLPRAARLRDQWLVVWQDLRQFNDFDLRGILLDARGHPLDTSFPIVTTANNQGSPVVAAGDSTWLVLWVNGQNTGSEQLRATRVNSQGVVLDPGGFAVTPSGTVNRHPALAFDGTNWVVAYWTWRSLDAYYVYAARITQAGTVLDPNGFQVVPIVYGLGWNLRSSVGLAFDGTNYLMTWPDYRNSDWDIFAARFTPAAQVLDSGGFVVSNLPGVEQSFPDVAFGAGTYLVFWQDARPGGLYLARVTPGGVSLDTTGIPVCTSPGTRRALSPAFSGTNFLVTWTDSRGNSIYGTRIRPDGVVLEPEGFPIATSAFGQEGSAVAGAVGSVLITWSEYYDAPYFTNRITAALFTETSGQPEPEAQPAGLQLRPNPCRGRAQLTVRLKAPAQLTVSDATGRLVGKRTLAAGATVVELPRLKAGIYFVQLQGGTPRPGYKLVVE